MYQCDAGRVANKTITTVAATAVCRNATKSSIMQARLFYTDKMLFGLDLLKMDEFSITVQIDNSGYLDLLENHCSCT